MMSFVTPSRPRMREVGMRSGEEPDHARSPLRMRLILATTGLLSWTAGAVVLLVRHDAIWALAFGVGACLAMVNIAVVLTRIRAGAHWQPGPAVPPYRPLEPAPGTPAAPRPLRRQPQRVRVRRYLLIMSASLVLLLTAWGWVWRISMPAAETMSLLAMVLLPVAAFVANAGPRAHRPELPGGDPAPLIAPQRRRH
jgi:hypothetical protein